MTENPKLVAVFYTTRQPAPILTEIVEEKHFAEICEHFPTDWGILIDVQTGEILDTYNQ